ncbi:MAG: hypothetical protein QM778_06425 [Myxococcales bacterium]
MIEPSPLETDTAIYRIQALRRARQIALLTVKVNEQEIERELDEVDAATLGTSPDELRALRPS